MEINKSRWKDFAPYLKERGFKVGVEIGVERGMFSKTLCSQYPEVKLYCIDPWKAYKTYREHVSQEKLDGFYEDTKQRLSHFNCEIIRKFSIDAVKDFEDESLDFIYIDANHNYENVMLDMILWLPKLKKGGMLAGHDYKKFKGQNHIYGVVPAVNDYAKFLGKELIIWRGDKSPSWSFIK